VLVLVCVVWDIDGIKEKKQNKNKDKREKKKKKNKRGEVEERIEI